MKIYTRTGDDGTTGLFGGDRVRKDASVVEAYGTVDELNALLGVAASQSTHEPLVTLLQKIQGQLFVLGAELSCKKGFEERLGMPLVADSHVEELESAIDLFEAELEPLTNFILPGGSPAAASLHHGRTICRRAERRLLSIGDVRETILHYVNRLSDLLFVLARAENLHAGSAEQKWIAPRN